MFDAWGPAAGGRKRVVERFGFCARTSAWGTPAGRTEGPLVLVRRLGSACQANVESSWKQMLRAAAFAAAQRSVLGSYKREAWEPWG